MNSSALMDTKLHQSLDLFHKDFVAGPTSRNYLVYKTLHEKARWCFLNKCKNNIYD